MTSQWPRLRLIMAVSSDGFVARGPDDDMGWTGAEDKALFRLLTSSGHSPTLLAGRRTFELLPPLPGRHVVPLSREHRKGHRLIDAARLWPDAWLIGGCEVALEALRGGFVAQYYLCWATGATLRSGISVDPLLEAIRADGGWGQMRCFQLGGVVVNEGRRGS